MFGLRFLLSLALLLAIQGLNANTIPFSDLKNAFALAEDGDANANPITVEKIDYRLPNDVKPIHYKIKLTPNLLDFTFEGESIIKIQVLKNTQNITLHSRDINYIDGLTQVNITNKNPLTAKHSYDKNKDFLILQTETEFKEKDEVSIFLKYTGVLNDQLRGFYRSSYFDKDGKQRWLATTHFEPTGARLAFPCFDEPALKATFDISIDIKNVKSLGVYNAISNMPVKTPATEKNTLIVFNTTPLMSTYLVAFVVSDFKVNTNKTNTDKPIMSVWIQDQLLPNTDFARDTGTKIISALEDYLNVPYQLPKMDQIGIPDFIAGAMENWGLVTYKEKALVYNEKTSTASEKQAVASIIAHEFAHQWFGDHVSPAWWKYVWLNEGFATLFQDFITDKIYDFKMRDQFVVKSLQGTAFSFDAIESSHPMNVEVNSPYEISRIFDSITYQKSGSVIRMMQHFLTDDVFQKGLNIYLNKLENKAATSDDLFNALNEAWKNNLNLTVKEIMDTWVTQPGYPVIHVMRSNENLYVHQKRFLMQKPLNVSDTQKWWIPINFVTASNVDKGFENTTASHWLSPNKTLEINNVTANEWFIFNKQQTGYYRVNYDKENWNLISAFLKTDNFTKIHNLSRAQLIDDAWSLARSGELNYEIPLTISDYLIKEINYLPWYSAIRNLNYLKSQLISTPHYKIFKETALKWSTKLVESVGFLDKEKEDHITKLTRTLALDWVCGLGFENCTKEYEGPFNSWVKDEEKSTISPNLKSLVLCSGLKTANETMWNKVYEKYLASKDPSEKNLLLISLGCSRNATILGNYLDLAINATFNINDTRIAFQAVYNGNEIGLNVALNFIAEKSHGIIQHDKGEIEYLQKYISAIGKKITVEEQLTKLKDFIYRSISLQGDATTSATDGAQKNIDWIKKNGEDIESIFNNLHSSKSNNSGGASSLQFAAISALIPVFIALFNF